MRRYPDEVKKFIADNVKGTSVKDLVEIRKYILENYKGVGPTSFLIRTGDKVSD